MAGSYYDGAWATYGVELEGYEGPSQSDMSGISSGRQRTSEMKGGAENYDIVSSVSEDSWWTNDGWSWASWEDSSGSSRENWVYVSKRDRNHWKGDPWHSWHRTGWRNEQGGSDPGQGQRSRALRGYPVEEGERSADSEGDGCPKGDLPSGKVMSVHEKLDREEEKKVHGKISNSYPPVFRARQGENFREWKRSVKFWMKGEGQQLPTSLIGPRVMVQLRDRAAQLVKHLEPEDVDGPDGLELIFKTLESTPLIRQSEKHRVDWHRKRLLNLTRLAGGKSGELHHEGWTISPTT